MAAEQSILLFLTLAHPPVNGSSPECFRGLVRKLFIFHCTCQCNSTEQSAVRKIAPFQSPPPADRISSSPLSKAWGGVSRFLVHAQPIFKIIVTVQELKRVEGGCVAFDVGSSAREFQKSLAILESAFSLEPFCERSPVRANVVYPDFNFLWQNNFGLADSISQMRFSNGI